MNKLVVQPLTAQNAIYTGSSVSVISVSSEWVLFLEVFNQTPNTVSRLTFEDSSDGFSSDILPGPSVSLAGQLGDGSGLITGYCPNVRKFSFTMADWEDLRIGISSCDLRLCVTDLSGNDGSPSIVYQAWIEY